MTEKEKETNLLERMRKIGSTVYADVMDMDNTMDYQIKPVNFKEPLVGRIRTVSLPPGDNLFLHHAIYQAEPGEILVVNGKGYTNKAYLGEIMAGISEKAGIKGIVIDGLIRDKKDLQQMDIQVYAKGAISAGPTKNGPGVFDEPTTCGGVTVSPYDYLVADADGVVIIPKHKIEETVEKAEKKFKNEEVRINKIQSFAMDGEESLDTLKPEWFDEKIKEFL